MDAHAARAALATLGKAELIWSALADTNTDAADGSRNGRGNELPPAEPIAQIQISRLPPRASLDSRSATADMQPALVKATSGGAVELHCWQPVSKRWRLLGEMQIPSTTFSWQRHAVDGCGEGPFELLVEVDLGDGKPLDLGCRVVDDRGTLQLENEYVASQRFINLHDALNNNWLEEIARKVRAVCQPVLDTVTNLRQAMEEQN